VSVARSAICSLFSRVPEEASFFALVMALFQVPLGTCFGKYILKDERENSRQKKQNAG